MDKRMSRYNWKASSDALTDVPLRVVIVDGMLAIELGLNTLKTVVEHGPVGTRCRVKDINALARELVVILENDEDETGMTPIKRAIDAAIEQVYEDGSSALVYTEDKA